MAEENAEEVSLGDRSRQTRRRKVRADENIRKTLSELLAISSSSKVLGKLYYILEQYNLVYPLTSSMAAELNNGIRKRKKFGSTTAIRDHLMEQVMAGRQTEPFTCSKVVYDMALRYLSERDGPGDHAREAALMAARLDSASKNLAEALLYLRTHPVFNSPLLYFYNVFADAEGVSIKSRDPSSGELVYKLYGVGEEPEGWQELLARPSVAEQVRGRKKNGV